MSGNDPSGLSRIGPAASYLVDVLPPVSVIGAGLALSGTADVHRAEPPLPVDPAAPAKRSTEAEAEADAKAATKTTDDDLPARSLIALLDHLATLTRADLRYGETDTSPTVLTVAQPTPPSEEPSSS